ncbi:hypothetical protein CPB84DRAFT_411658 [Gymnopilus junonius]|uniref:Winged helix-turn helix domain-containing protein n=1 Tax=Gymnopilus junonius TaxID=109634 RepID=A0A9P5THR5_GYMJU|nr:hypothetical protein CPB84DRAFT_411658 [Gymnopilus junonius]
MRRLRKTFRETGETVPVQVVQGRPRLLDALDADVNFLEGLIERQPDMLLSELQDHLREVCGIHASTGTIARTLHRRGFTMKRITQPAIERDENDRALYKMLIGEHFSAEQLGTRARRRDFFIRGVKYSILPALSLDGILHLEVLNHAFDGDEFSSFYSQSTRN